jgi:tetratricopeptide (TPR) repeat protein
VEIQTIRAELASRDGDFAQAIASQSEALARATADLGDDASTVLAYLNFGDTLLRAQQRYPEARTAYQQAGSMIDRMNLDNAEYRLAARTGVPRVDVETGHPDAALQQLEPIVALYGKGDFDPEQRALALAALGRALAALHRDPARVRQLLEEARPILAGNKALHGALLDAIDRVLSSAK